MPASGSAIGLGPRLRAIAERALPGLAVADLCCDHAKLAAALVLEGRVPRAIAVDVNAAPLDAAASLLRALGLEHRVELRRGDGASVLRPGEVGTVVIAGVGAPLAERIVEQAEATGRLAGVGRLIVQANHGFPKLGALRGRLDALGWAIVDEAIARDQGRLYPILVCERGEPGRLDAAARELGPSLRSRHDPLTRAWFERERERVRRALAGMRSGQADADTRIHYRRYLESLDSLAGSKPNSTNSEGPNPNG